MIWKVLIGIGIVFAVIAAIVLFGYAYGSRHFIVDEQTLYFDNLPEEFDGYRIVQFSDFHAGAFHMGHDEDVDRIVSLINEQDADMVAFTGDIVTRSAEELNGFETALSRISAHDGVFSVTGNHDYAIYNRGWNMARRKADAEKLQRKERSFGWNLLMNESVIIRRGGDSIAVMGIENYGEAFRFPKLGNLEKAKKGVKDGMFQILLSHDPTAWKKLVISNSGIDLTLSGHTHAGQFKMFGWSLVKYVYDEWSGAYKEGKQQIYVSDGVGCVPFPYRIGAWPEINVIKLSKAQSE